MLFLLILIILAIWLFLKVSIAYATVILIAAIVGMVILSQILKTEKVKKFLNTTAGTVIRILGIGVIFTLILIWLGVIN